MDKNEAMAGSGKGRDDSGLPRFGYQRVEPWQEPAGGMRPGVGVEPALGLLSRVALRRLGRKAEPRVCSW